MKHMIKHISDSTNRLQKLRPSTIDGISSVSDIDNTINTETHIKSELRDVRIVSPYGISSRPVGNIKVQVIRNGGIDTAVGVIDPKKPDAPIGGSVLYDSAGNVVKLDNKQIVIRHISGTNITITGGSIVLSDGSNSVSLADIVKMSEDIDEIKSKLGL